MNFASPVLVTAIQLTTATAILAAGVADLLRANRYRAWIFALSCLGGLASSFAIGGWLQVSIGVLGFCSGFALLFPLVLMKVVTANDMKLMAALGCATSWTTVLAVGLAALVWGAIFGVVRAIKKGEGRTLVSNLISLISLKPRQALAVHTVPFTTVLLVGWFTIVIDQRFL